MRNFKRALLIPIILAICFFVPAVDSSAVSLLPTANFNGYFQTTPGGLSFFSTAISKIDYVDSGNPYGEDSTRTNLTGVESLIGAKVILSGALRADGYTFSDAVLEIQDITNAHTYFSAALGNVEFIEQSGVYYLLNPNLDGDDPDTLNLSNIDLSVNALFPSLYIEQLGSALEIQGISGMKMTLRSFGGDFSNYSSGFIVEGLIDGIKSPGAPAPVPEPSTFYLLGLGLIGFAGYRKRFRA